MNELQEQINAIDKRNFNKGNLAFVITILIITINCFILHMLYTKFGAPNVFSDAEPIYFCIPILIMLIGFWVGFPLSLILQILHKKKNVIDVIALSVNVLLVFCIFSITTLMLSTISADKFAKMQIKKEQTILIEEYQPVLDYLAKYKRANGVYPEEINKSILPKSKTFKKVEYGRTKDNTAYWLKIKPKRHSIDHYHTNKSDDGYKSYKGTGYIDGFMDNEYYYEINDDWYAIRYGL